MRPYVVWTAVYALLLAGSGYAATEGNTIDTYNRNIVIEKLPAIAFDSYIGANHSVIFNATTGYIKEQCLLRTPDDEQLVLTDGFDNPGIRVIDGSDCGVKIIVKSDDMSGDWALIGRYNFFGQLIERRLSFTINFDGVYTTDKDSEFIDEDGITWLTPIEHRTRTDVEIDITLDVITQVEECYIKPPNGDFVRLEEASITGVTSHGKSAYVSCRVTIGPMVDTLLGNWTLCGRYIDIEKRERCQIVSILWNNNNNPSALWHSTLQRVFNHTVNIGGILTPVVVGTGSLLTCHVITPEGEDLVMTPDSHYPGITQVAINAADTCSVAIGPIDYSMLGAWSIYGKFHNIVIQLNEVRLPMNLILYDEENPYAQAYNITNENPINRVIHLGSTITAELTGVGNIDNCIYRSPKGEFYEINGHTNFNGVAFINDTKAITCRISMGPITEEMLGEWQIIGKFNDGNIFDERRQIFHVIQEDPKNPIIDEDRRVVNVTPQHYDANIGSSLIITSTLTSFVTRQSCHVRTPAGLQYKIMDGFNLPGVEVIENANIECGLNITVLSEDLVGDWTLISRVLSLGEPIERRLPFTIYVEEIVGAFPELITVAAGNSINVRLKDPTDLYNTCKLIGPNENERHHEIDPIHYESCGFIIDNAQQTDSGKWNIIYGNSIVYRAYIEINVIDRQELTGDNLSFIKDRGVRLEIGPEDVVYCKIEDPMGLVVFDGFGKCNIVLERVTMEHNGYWKMSVGLPGQVIAIEESFMVIVKEAEPKAVVSTQVVRENPTVVLTCSVNSPSQVRACVFRNPKGEVRIAAQGVGENRYVSQSSQVTYESDIHGHECGLRITEPTSEDLGLWRCAIETENDTYYGFLTVLCPWLIQNPEFQEPIVTEPVLTSDRTSVASVEGDTTTMSCSIQASIKYCYFRAQNGTVFSVTPATSTATMEYVGNGFDAGECGIRFNNLRYTDSGRWSCHVGLVDGLEQEHRAPFQVTVQEPITARHYRDVHRGLVVEAIVHGNRQLEYCRFVRIDGLGFITEHIPAGYNDLSSLRNGNCLLQIEEATILNLHPWTVAAKVRGQDVELTSITMDDLLEFNVVSGTWSLSTHIWITLILIGLALLLLGVSIGPKKNRQWTYARASQLRNSIRSSMRKTKSHDTV